MFSSTQSLLKILETDDAYCKNSRVKLIIHVKYLINIFLTVKIRRNVTSIHKCRYSPFPAYDNTGARGPWRRVVWHRMVRCHSRWPHYRATQLP